MLTIIELLQKHMFSMVSECLFNISNDIIGRVLSVVCEGRRSLGGLEVVRGIVCSGSGG